MLDAAFGPEYIIVKATMSHQRQGVDRFFVHRRDRRVIFRVNYKNDEMAGTTGNLAFEVESLRLAWPDIMQLFPPRFAATASANPYQSLVLPGMNRQGAIPWRAGAGRGGGEALRAAADEAAWDAAP